MPNGSTIASVLYLVSAARPVAAPTHSQARGGRPATTTSTPRASTKAAVAADQASLLMVTAVKRNWGLKAAIAAAARAKVGARGANRRAIHQVQSRTIRPPRVETKRAAQAGAKFSQAAPGRVMLSRAESDLSK